MNLKWVMLKSLLLAIICGWSIPAHADLIQISGWTPGADGTTFSQWDRSFPITNILKPEQNKNIFDKNDYSLAPVNSNPRQPGIFRSNNNSEISNINGDALRHSGTFNFSVEARSIPGIVNTGYTSLLVQLESSIANGKGWNWKIGDLKPVDSGVIVTDKKIGLSTATYGWALFQLAGRDKSYKIDVTSIDTTRIYERLHSLRVDTAYTSGNQPLTATIAVPEPSSLLILSSLGACVLSTRHRRRGYVTKTGK